MKCALEDGSSIEAHGIFSVDHYRGPMFPGLRAQDATDQSGLW